MFSAHSFCRRTASLAGMTARVFVPTLEHITACSAYTFYVYRASIFCIQPAWKKTVPISGTIAPLFAQHEYVVVSLSTVNTNWVMVQRRMLHELNQPATESIGVWRVAVPNRSTVNSHLDKIQSMRQVTNVRCVLVLPVIMSIFQLLHLVYPGTTINWLFRHAYRRSWCWSESAIDECRHCATWLVSCSRRCVLDLVRAPEDAINVRQPLPQPFRTLLTICSLAT